MPKLFSRYPRRSLALLLALLLYALFQLGKGQPALLALWARQVADPLRRFLGGLCAPLPFAVMELLYVAGALWLLLYLFFALRRMLRCREQQALQLGGLLLTLGCVALWICTLFGLLWGANYYAPGFQEQSGIYAREVSVEELHQVTSYFARELSARAGDVPRDEAGVCQSDKAAAFAASTEIYSGIARRFPFLSLSDYPAKPMLFSSIMSYMGFTGVTFAFTGEACLNTHMPASCLPATIAHELAHQRGIASEQECNFLAVLACLESGNADYIYSGWLLGYIHLANALYRADPQLWRSVYDSLDSRVKADLSYRSAYWRQFEGPVNTVSESVYDSMLKDHGESAGIRSYGMVMDLLVVYFKDTAAQ